MKRARRWLLVVVLLAGSGAGLVAVLRPRATPATENRPAVPTARVQRGSLELLVYMNGDLRASQQQAIMAPPVGSALRILRFVDSGTAVKKDDIVLAFDPADQLYALEQARSEVLEAEQEIIKRRATTAVQVGQDKVALLTAQSDVRRAELDAAVDQDLIPANVFQVRQRTLVEARRILAQTVEDVRSRGTVNQAGLTVLEEARAKAQTAVDRATQNIDSLNIKAPIDGVVSVRENADAAGGFFFSGMTLPQYRVGDTVSAGRPVFDIFDTSSMEIQASVNEQERSNVAVGQSVRVDSPVAPGAKLTAKVTAIAGLGRPDDSGGPLRNFQVTLKLDHADVRLRPGTSVKIVVEGQKLEAVLLVPRQAVFEKDGQPVVYLRSATGFSPHEIKVVNRTESQTAIQGIEEGAEVAMINPEAASTKAAPPSTASPAIAR
jgi:HlyD family secretion protein